MDFLPKSTKNYGFNGIKHMHIDFFFQVDPRIDYTLGFCGYFWTLLFGN